MSMKGKRMVAVWGLLLFAALAKSTLAQQECISDAPVTFEDSSMLQHVENCIAAPEKYSITYKTMDSLLKNGFLKSADFALKNYFLKQNVDISEPMKSTILDVKGRLEGLLKMISQVKKALIAMPVFMWGQSDDSIFLHVKFSHRFDTPGCLDITEEKFEIKDNKLYYQANCMQTHQPINFILDINLFDEAVDEGKVIRKGSVGTRVLEFKKKQNSIWKNLHDDTEKFSRLQMRVWWELKDIYPEAMKKYSKLLEQDEEEDEVGSSLMQELWGDLAKKKNKQKKEEDTEADAETTKTADEGQTKDLQEDAAELDPMKIARGPTEVDL